MKFWKKGAKTEQQAGEAPAAAPKTGKKKGKKWPWVVGIGLAAVVGISVLPRLMGGSAGMPVEAAYPQKEDMQELVDATGTVESSQKKTYFAQVSGTLASVLVKNGDEVKKGDVLISYDLDKAQRMYAQAGLTQEAALASYQSAMLESSKSQNKLAEAQTNLQVLDVQIADYEAYLKDLQDQLKKQQRENASKLAEESYEISDKLSQTQSQIQAIQEKGASATAEEKANLSSLQGQAGSLSRAQARNAYLQSIANAQDYVVKMQDEISRVETELAKCRSYKAEMQSQKSAGEAGSLNVHQQKAQSANSEIAQLTHEQAQLDFAQQEKGVVADFDGIVTEVAVQEGATVAGGTPMLALSDSRNLQVRFQATKYDMEKIELGQTANVKILGRDYAGKVSKINRVAQSEAGAAPKIGVVVTLDKADSHIILGIDAKVEVLAAKVEDALTIPIEALNADQEGDYVFVIQDGLAKRRAVKAGISTASRIQVLEGLTEQDQVIISSAVEIVEDLPVAAQAKK